MTAHPDGNDCAACNYESAIFTTTGRTCTAYVFSDEDRGGWRVDCATHGRITTRDTIGAAEASAVEHLAARDRIGS